MLDLIARIAEPLLRLLLPAPGRHRAVPGRHRARLLTPAPAAESAGRRSGAHANDRLGMAA